MQVEFEMGVEGQGVEVTHVTGPSPSQENRRLAHMLRKDFEGKKNVDFKGIQTLWNDSYGDSSNKNEFQK